jgi:Flp pilus assembly protein TadD
MAAPGDAEAVKIYNTGAEHFKKGQFELAAECFKKAAELDGKLYRAWAYLGMAYAQTGQLDPAIEAYRKCIDIAPDYHKAFNNVGELYRRKGQLDYAAMVFKMATEIAPTLPHYFYNLGITYFEIGMYPQSEQAFAKAFELDRGDHEYATELAQVQFTQKKFEAAAGTLETWIKDHPDSEKTPETRARLAMLKRLAEQQKAAQAQMGSHKSEIRSVALDEDDGEVVEDENAQTKPDLPNAAPGQKDPEKPSR